MPGLCAYHDAMMVTPRYVGRYALAPGPLHAGSMVAALASWRRQGTWRPMVGAHRRRGHARCVPEAEAQILRQLSACGLHPTALWHQSQRGAAYADALAQLQRAGLVYGCACSRQDIARAHDGALATGQVLPYPGTCRHGTHGKPVRAWRLHTQRAGWLRWHDRRLGWQQQWLAREVGDVVLRRADGLWAYQLAVVVDDAAQGITDVVRGEDLVDNTPRQRLLQQVLGLPRLRYLHTPLVRNAKGHKLSKQTGAAAVATETDAEVRHTLTQAAQALALHAPQAWQPVPHWLAQAVAQWAQRWGL